MAWGGGGFGGGGGGGFVGAQAAAQSAGLPFGGIPTELQQGVDRILATEPAPEPSTEVFTQRPSARDRQRLSIPMLVGEHPVLVAGGAACVLVVGALGVAGPLLVGWAIDYGIKAHDLRKVEMYAAAYLVISFVVAYTQRAGVHLWGRLAARVMHRLRILVFTHLQRLSLDFFTEEKAGVLMSRMTSDIENLQQFLQDGISSFGIQLVSMVTIIIVLFKLDAKLAMLSIVAVVPLLLVLTIWFHRASERGYLRARDGIANVLSDLSESLYGVRVITATNRQRYNVVQHRNVVGEYRDANLYTGRANAIYGPATVTITILGQALLLGVGGNAVLHDQLSIGVLVSFVLYLGRFFQPIQLLVQQYNTFQQGQASIIKLRTLVDTEPEVREAPDATELPPITGRIVVDDVAFGYDPSVLVLEDVDLTVEPGETVAFVGPTGAGKSTLAKLVTRFYDPTAGRVLIDGHDLRGVTLHSLRSQLGVVPQEPFLFAGTIGDNIAFARPTAPETEIREAVERVGLTDVIDAMPNGLDTVVHERGQTLSSGERQLIALARAFLAHPRVLVLDEATSNLDLKSETKIEAALDVLLENRTAILIAHRLSTAMRADRIAVVDAGRIVEVGSHRELVESGGLYAEMYETWVRHSEGREVEEVGDRAR